MSKSAREVMAEMEGQPMPVVAERLANLMEEAGVSVPMEVHLAALGSALLNVVRLLAHDVGALIKAQGANVEPGDYANRFFQLALLQAQADVYEQVMPKPGLTLVPEIEGQLVVEWTPEDE